MRPRRAARPVFEGGRMKCAGAVRRTGLRALAVLTLAGVRMLVFGLLPGGRDAGAVVPSKHLLPAVSALHSMHPYGPNRPKMHRYGRGVER
jgi:hypothetical protein